MINLSSVNSIIGKSREVSELRALIKTVGPSNATVLITGDSGTGKELVAQALHNCSARATGAFIPVNCGAIPRDLLESELFGHKKGAFTGALSDRKGRFQLANNGTLFLDEIGDMSMDLQVKLLRVLQERIIDPVGSQESLAIDVRVVAATHKNIEALIQQGKFREDLYYRLHVVPIHLPALNEHSDDILAIAKQFLLTYADEENKSFKHFSNEVKAVLMNYAWPGNVRQLQNVIRNIVVLNEDETVKISHLPPPLNAELNGLSNTSFENASLNISDNTLYNNADIRPLAQVEREVIEHAIAICGDNIPKAAAILEVSPSTIYRKKQTWEQD